MCCLFQIICTIGRYALFFLYSAALSFLLLVSVHQFISPSKAGGLVSKYLMFGWGKFWSWFISVTWSLTGSPWRPIDADTFHTPIFAIFTGCPLILTSFFVVASQMFDKSDSHSFMYVHSLLSTSHGLYLVKFRNTN